VKTFSFSTFTGYSSADAMTKGLKNSIWLSLVPASWQDGLATTPGTPTDKPGTGPNGTGPAPRTTAQATNPNANATGGNDVESNDPNAATHPGAANTQDGGSGGGCSMTNTNTGSTAGLFGLALVGALALLRHKRNKQREEV
jgi:MYXO-CTERM domain-containing protein